MKRTFSIVLALVLCILMLSGCGVQNIEEYSDDRSIVYRISEYEAVYLEFEDGQLTVNLNVYDVDPSSPSGKFKNFSKSESFTFSYTLEGDNYVYVAGEKYYYTIDKEGLHFSVKFLGISKEWN